MSSFWSLFIILLTTVNIVGLVWLLFSTARKRSSDKPAEATTGHVWDGDIAEYNKPLPRWWLGLFVMTVIFGLAYLVFYPGLGTFAGTLGWTSENERKADIAAQNKKFEEFIAQFLDKSLLDLAHDSKALSSGQNIFANNCAACHGSDARGAKGFPNLTDQDWLWGGEPDTIFTSVLGGRNAVMPALEAALGEQGVNEVANYILSLSGQKVDSTLVEAGKTRYRTICIACHGPEAKGNPIMGAPNLTDNIWLYGGSLDDIKKSIRNGRNGAMPAWEPILGKDRARLVAAWVIAQSKTSAGNATPPPTVGSP